MCHYLYQFSVAAPQIVVNVLDVNDNAPAFQGSVPYSVNVKEDQEIGKTILKVTATDGDSGDNGTVRYEITAGNNQGNPAALLQPIYFIQQVKARSNEYQMYVSTKIVSVLGKKSQLQIPTRDLNLLGRRLCSKPL